MSVSGEPGATVVPTLISFEASCTFRPCFLVPVIVAIGRASPTETRAILTNGERPHSISR
jgi:hypothetical protein